jgi:FkbM family methyltransferase
MIKILDIGCRYGIFPTFKESYKFFEYIGVDADASEILRLRKKYHNEKNTKFFSEFLGSENKKINFKIHKHKGYSTSNRVNKESLWFGKIRKNEKSIIRTKKIDSIKSSEWINKNVPGKLIIKLDIEGGELDFLKGLTRKNFNNIQAIVAETHFESPFLSSSNFGSIFTFLTKKGYWLTHMDVNHEKLSIYSDKSDQIPHSATSTFLKKTYSPIKHNLKEIEIKCEVLYALKLNSLLIEFLKYCGYKRIKNVKILDKIKFVCGHKFNLLKKEPFSSYNLCNKDFKKIFNENLPNNSDFYENNFYNPK